MLKGRGFKMLAALVGVSLAGVVGTAQALTLSIGDAYYVGRINDGIPSNPADEVDYINTLRGLATGASPIQLPALTGEFYDRLLSGLDMSGSDPAVLLGSIKNDSGSNSFTINGSAQYILGKYDAEKAGSYVWYLDSGFTGNIVIPSKAGDCGKPGEPAGCGLSHFTVFNPGDGDLDLDVPEPGSLALLGLGLIGLGFVRRRQTT
jgi:hypothetical protein